MKIRLILSALALACSPVLASAANLVVNGGFEQTSLTRSGTLDNNATGWTSTAAWNQLFFPGEADTVGALDEFGQTIALWGPGNGVNNGLTATSPAGGNFISSDGDPDFSGSISQRINGLQAGQQYVLSFYYGAAEMTMRRGETTDYWQVTLGNGPAQYTPTINLPDQGFSGWFKATMTFTAQSSSELLSFLAVGTPRGLPPVSLLDGVEMTAAVPEPTSVALLLAGLVGVVGAARRQKAK